MKRHPTLVPLSRDHHDGLLLATRLQQGKRALLRLWSHDPLWQAQYIVQFYDEHLTKHFTEEEDILFPAVKPHLKQHSTIIERLLDEHKKMAEIVATLRKPTGTDLEQRLMEFGRLLENHIHCEERELFPLCEELLPEETWKNIENMMKNKEGR